MKAIEARLEKMSAVQEVLWMWGVCFFGVVLAFIVARQHATVVATVGFLYLPLLAMRRRNEDYRDYGVTLRNWRGDLKMFAAMALVVGPLYFAGYWAFGRLLPHLPHALATQISPYADAASGVVFRPRLPDRFAEYVIHHLFVVALPEEFFYRGYLQARLRDAWPQGRMFFGARLGKAFWITQLLFALGHLAVFALWRPFVFFPALLFGWMRERSGTVMGAALFHAACNLFEMFLAASFFGRP